MGASHPFLDHSNNMIDNISRIKEDYEKAGGNDPAFFDNA